VDVAGLPGRPDIAFHRYCVAVFCDGDFWHGRHLEDRVARLAKGHNAPYWVAKISGNVARDRRNDDALRAQGWVVLRFWETDIIARATEIADEVASLLAARGWVHSGEVARR
jgi:DNA mismatch endonuclease (patch repair protein)